MAVHGARSGGIVNRVFKNATAERIGAEYAARQNRSEISIAKRVGGHGAEAVHLVLAVAKHLVVEEEEGAVFAAIQLRDIDGSTDAEAEVVPTDLRADVGEGLRTA